MRNLKFWFPFIGYSAIIFGISSLTHQQLSPIEGLFWDKLLHTVEYAGLAVTAAYAWDLSKPKWFWVKKLFFASFVSFLYALSDEFHQYFVPGRSSDLHDVLADTLGCVIGAGIYLIVRKRVMNNGRNQTF